MEKAKQTLDAFQQPMFQTKSDWQLPESLPRLGDAKAIGLDIETKDIDLKSKGPGVRREGNYILGISVAVPDGLSWYLPFAHPGGKQFAKEIVLRWAREELCRPNQPKVGANLLYDLDFLYHEGVEVSGPFYDIQVAEPLLDENRYRYSLDELAKDYLGETKDEKLIKEATRSWVKKKSDSPQAYLWRLPSDIVGPYAESDASQPLRIFKKQWKQLQSEDLLDLFKMESDLIPVLLKMRQRGVRIDLEKLDRAIDQKEKELKVLQKKLKGIDPWSNQSIAKMFDKENVDYPRTERGNPSFQQIWLERHSNPVAQLIVKYRKTDKLIGTFLRGSINDMLIGDRLHCQFNQLKSDDTGTVTGRFSSSNPNLQFIPARDKEIGPLCRSLFIPDEGEDWARSDYSQIEIRILVHYAIGRGAKDIVQAYIDKPDLDYHQWCADTAHKSRTQAKTINFGIIYGMGADKLANSLGISVNKAREFLIQYYAELPFLKRTMSTATSKAANDGYVRTILGRKRRFILWEPRNKKIAKEVQASPDKDSVNKRTVKRGGHGIQRAGTYKAFNAIDQGTAADIMKKAMVDIDHSGVCDVLGPPLLTVHDELDWTIPRTKIGKEAFVESCRIMEKAVPLKIPVLVDHDIGANWSEVK